MTVQQNKNSWHDVKNNGNFPKIWQKVELIVTGHAIYNIKWWIEFCIDIFHSEGKEKVMLNYKKFEIYFEVLCNCEKWLLRSIRIHHNTCKLTQIA